METWLLLNPPRISEILDLMDVIRVLQIRLPCLQMSLQHSLHPIGELCHDYVSFVVFMNPR